MDEQHLVKELLQRGIFKDPAKLSRFAGYSSPAQIYRVLEGKGKLGGPARKKLEEKLEQVDRPAPVFAPILEESHVAGERWLRLETEYGAEMRIPLKLKDGRWVVSGAFDLKF